MLPELIKNTRLVALPSTAKLAAPGPLIVTLLFTVKLPLVSVIGPVTAKLIVVPSSASASAWRSEPAPLSLVLVTVIVVGASAVSTMFVFEAAVISAYYQEAIPDCCSACQDRKSINGPVVQLLLRVR